MGDRTAADGDTIDGGKGNDFISGVVDGDQGNDTVSGGADSDTLDGGSYALWG